MGREAKFEGGSGRVIAIEVNEFGNILLSIAPSNGSKIVFKKMEECSLGKVSNSAEELVLAFQAASQHRSSVAKNIAYASHISGEDTTLYEIQLKKCDELCMALGDKMKKSLPIVSDN